MTINQDSAKNLAMMLTQMGNEAQTAYDGLEMIDLAETFRPDLIMLDIGMPRLNGHLAAQRIRARPWGMPMLLIAVSGWRQTDDRRLSAELDSTRKWSSRSMPLL